MFLLYLHNYYDIELHIINIFLDAWTPMFFSDLDLFSKLNHLCQNDFTLINYIPTLTNVSFCNLATQLINRMNKHLHSLKSI